MVEIVTDTHTHTHTHTHTGARARAHADPLVKMSRFFKGKLNVEGTSPRKRHQGLSTCPFTVFLIFFL